MRRLHLSTSIAAPPPFTVPRATEPGPQIPTPEPRTRATQFRRNTTDPSQVDRAQTKWRLANRPSSAHPETRRKLRRDLRCCSRMASFLFLLLLFFFFFFLRVQCPAVAPRQLREGKRQRIRVPRAVYRRLFVLCLVFPPSRRVCGACASSCGGAFRAFCIV